MKNLFFIIGLCFSSAIGSAPHLFKSIDQFIKEVIPVRDQEEFEAYYQNQLQGLKTYSPQGRRQRVGQMYKQGYAALEVKYSQVYDQLNASESTLCQIGKQEVKRMAVRLGFYEDYCREKAEKNLNFFTRFRNYIENITHSIAHWIGGRS